MTLDARLGYATDGFDLDASFRASPGETVVVVGPNGAGKTTVLDLVAGLRCLDRGSLRLGGRPLDDPGAGVWVAPEHRSVGYVHQDGALFPHLSAVDNVAFGLRCAGVRRQEARRRAAGWLERVGLADRSSARPDLLSGGQAQRVALARALAAEPGILLLDEPLASLDAGARVELRRLLRRQLADFAGVALLVTHDPVEALALGDRLVVLDQGRMVQEGRPEDVARHPRSPHVAALVGLNLLPGRASGREVTLGSGATLAAADTAEGDVYVSVAATAVSVHRNRPEGSPRNVWEATVAGLDVEGDRVRLDLAGAIPVVAEVTGAAVADLELAEGARVWASVKATEVVVYPS